jgi:hypothetical protein
MCKEVDGFRVETVADGAVTVLRFSDARLTDISGRKLESLSGTSAMSAQLPRIQFEASFSGVGLSLVSGAPSEVLYASIIGVTLMCHQMGPKSSVDLRIQRLQMDNQQLGVAYPVALHQSTPTMNEDGLRCAMSWSACPESILLIHQATFCLGPADVCVDWQLVQNISDFADRCVSALDAASEAGTQAVYRTPLPPTVLYIEELLISPFTLHLSFSAQGIANLETTVQSMGLPLATIDGAPIRLSGLQLGHTRCGPAEVGNLFLMTCLHDLKGQIYKLILSLEVLGNPMAMVRRMKGAVGEVPPGYMAISRLLALRAVPSISDAITRAAKRVCISLLLSGAVDLPLPIGLIGRPTGLLSGFKLGIIGLVREPVLGTILGGWKGGSRGAIRGMAGLVLRPTFGMLRSVEWTASVFSKYLGSSPWNAKHFVRQRPARSLRWEGQVLTPYIRQENEGAEILSQVAPQELARGTCAVVMADLELGRTLLLTSAAAILVGDPRGEASVEWSIPLTSILRVQLRGDLLNMWHVPNGAEARGGLLVCEKTLQFTSADSASGMRAAMSTLCNL